MLHDGLWMKLRNCLGGDVMETCAYIWLFIRWIILKLSINVWMSCRVSFIL
jgi:hypothetical protein